MKCCFPECKRSACVKYNGSAGVIYCVQHKAELDKWIINEHYFDIFRKKEEET
jgi:hypothetical protein